MKLLTQSIISDKRSRSAATLIEIMVTVFISTIVFGALAMLWVNGARGILAMTNYTELDRRSKYALDMLSKDIRQATSMTAFSSNSITLTNSIKANGFSYVYDSSAKTLTRTFSGVPKVLLTECDQLTFAISQRNPTNSFTFAPATSIATAKLVDVNWKCSRQIKGQKVNTESIQTAKIVMRN